MLCKSKKTDEHKNHLCTGRGGGGSGNFVFAILDWEGYKRNRRTTYISITKNQNPPTITEQRWLQFVAEHGEQYDFSDVAYPIKK